MIIKRPFWQKLIEEAWQKKTVIWLMGVRRVGKTSLCKSLGQDIVYFDCELPTHRTLITADPEAFLESQKGNRIVLDEIHRLDNPSELLKIAADHYPSVKIIATGSSTLGTAAKFKDTLTDRKQEVWLTPLLLDELENFGSSDLRHRFLFGGFPSYFAETKLPESSFQEWFQAYWAKDIEEMFSVGKRASFLKFAELLLNYSSGQFEATKFAAACEVSRQTIANYLAVLELTFIVHVIRPFSSHRPTEIISAPKVYGFDTGFVCHAKGWKDLRSEDLGFLWEHIVLNEIHGHLQKREAIHYWRDKQGHEIDFVMHRKGTSLDNEVTAIECKFSMLENRLGENMVKSIGENIAAFRKLYPKGENLVVASNIPHTFERMYGDITLTFITTNELITRLKK